MKKSSAVLLIILFTVSVAVIAHAGHEHIIIPFEAQALGYKTSMPIPAGGDLRHHLVGHEPYKTWQTWPGKEKMYKGTEPHGSLLTT
jgi:hypothetical protein